MNDSTRHLAKELDGNKISIRLFTPLFISLDHHDSTVEGVRSSAEKFLSFFSRNASGSLLLDGVRSSSFTKQDARRLFSGILSIMKIFVSNRLNCSYHGSAIQEQISKTSDDLDLDFMKHSALLCSAYLDNLIQRRNPQDKRTSIIHMRFPVIKEVLELLNILHENFFCLTPYDDKGTNTSDNLGRVISKLCEQYWKGQFIDCECFVTQLIPKLLSNTLNEGATVSDLKRLWEMRHVMKLIDFDDESIAYLRGLLLRTVSNGLYIKHDIGRRLIRFFFLLDKALTSDLHNAIKVQILPTTKNSVLDTYGHIYLNAWRDAENSSQSSDNINKLVSTDHLGRSIQSVIEDNLQELVYASIHIANNKMAKCLRIFLEPLYLNKKTPDIDRLLYQLYNPIIWRAASAPNSLVRKRACSAFSLIHPLHYPMLGKVHLKEMQQKSLSILRGLLCDNDAGVRVAACDATIRILALYWNASSSADIRSFLNIIVIKHANDVSSTSVRVQALHGVMMLMDTKASHGVLKRLLPKLGNLIHDTSHRVRLACARFLLKVNTLNGVKFYHVVPSEHVIVRLAVEGNRCMAKGSLASTFTKLLLPSYFPQNLAVSEQINRIISFIYEYPSAAKVFYANVHYHLDLNSITKLIYMLIKTLLAGVQDAQKQNIKSTIGDNDSDNINVTKKANDIKLMMSVAETICCLWKCVFNDLKKEENKESLALIQGILKSDNTVQIYSYFETQMVAYNENEYVKVNKDHLCCICLELLYFSGCFTDEDTGNLSDFLLSRIEKFQENANLSSDLCLLCTYGMEERVAASLSSSITTALDEIDRSDHLPLLGRAQRKVDRKRSHLETSETSKESSLITPVLSELAFHILADILSGKSHCHVAARSKLIGSNFCYEIIQSALKKGLDIMEKILSAQRIITDTYKLKLVISSIESYGKLCLHKESEIGMLSKLSVQNQKLLSLVTNHAIPILQARKNETMTTSPSIDLNLSRISLAVSQKSPNISLPELQTRRKFDISPLASDSCFFDMETLGNEQCIVEVQSISHILVTAVSLSLIQSSLCIFAERISVGGEAHELYNHIIKWNQSQFTTNGQKFVDTATNLIRFVHAAKKSFSKSKELLVIISNILESSKGGCVAKRSLERYF